MKRIFGLAMCFLAVAIVADKRLTYVNRRKDPTVRLEADRGLVIPDENFILEGNVIVDNIAGNVRMNCDSATGKFVKSNGRTELNEVRMTGNFKLVQTSPEGNKTAATAEKGTYDLVDSKLVDVSLTGSVNANLLSVNPKKSDFTVKAQRGTARLDRTEKERDKQLVSATFSGPLTFSGYQLEPDEKSKKVVRKDVDGKANQLTFTRNGTSGRPEIRLVGDIEFLEKTDNDETGFVTGAQVAILELNAKNEIVKIRFSSDQKGQVKTVVKPSGGNR